MIPKDRLLTLWTLVCVFHLRIGLAWALTICETALIALVPLFIGFAIDSLLAEQTSALFQLAGVMAALIVVSVIRRIYDTRVFGTVRVEVGGTQATRASAQPVSKLNARLGMGRELVDFLEIELPMVTTAIIQIIISVIVLYMFDVKLALAAICAVIIMLVVYGLFHKQCELEKGEPERQKYQRSALRDTDMKRMAAKLDATMRDRQLWQNPNLSLHDFTRETGISQNNISQTLNDHLGRNFYDYVNGWRIDAACNLLRETHQSVLNISLDAGFNAKSTFNAAFRKVMDQTPRQFRTNAQLQISSLEQGQIKGADGPDRSKPV